MLIRARVLGFCMGVRRAVEMADAAVAGGASPIYTLGPLIHNPQVLFSFSQRGVKILDLPGSPATGSPATGSYVPGGSFAPGDTVIIRAHGVSPAVEQGLRDKGAMVIDATCPRVKTSQNIVFNLAREGYTIFLAGEKDHAEIKGIHGFCLAGNANCVIVGNPCEAGHIAAELAGRLGNIPAKTALIGQTTISEEEYSSIAGAIKKHFPGLEVKNTICDATRDRQNALKELCSAADAIIIAGGKESANTKRLLSIALGCGKEAWLAETAADLPPELLNLTKEELAEKKIGISAGASTPDSVIDEIEQALLL